MKVAKAGLPGAIAILFGVVSAGPASFVLGRSAEAQQPSVANAPIPVKPVISVNLLMVDFVDQAADTLWTAAVDPPKRACAWDQVRYRATQLATTGTLLRLGGTGPLDMQWSASPDWARFADNMTTLALAAAQAAKERNAPALKEVGDQLILNCEACHRAFKPEIPTQNITTHLSHAVPLSEGLPPNCPKK